VAGFLNGFQVPWCNKTCCTDQREVFHACVPASLDTTPFSSL
jgi:hypothetical protein